MDLPGYTNDLISAVMAANPTTALVIQSGTPVRIPTTSSPDSPHSLPSTILQAWYGGNETGNAIADVLFGAINPSGKLSLSFPLKIEDNPAFLNYRSEGGRVLYGEDVYVGYRWYEKTKRELAFPFGHGLSYTRFEFSNLSIAKAGEVVKVAVNVENTGARDGAEVVQV